MVNIRSFALHRYAGLLASLWLLVLCISGIFLDHKKDWAFLWQWQWPTAWMSEQSAQASQQSRYHQVKFLADGRLFCDPSGCQREQNGTWQKSQFITAQPLIRHILIWQEHIFAATSQGIWRSTDNGFSFQPYALHGKNITYLAGADVLLAVSGQSFVWRIHSPENIAQLEIPRADSQQLAPKVNLGRLTHDLHFGRGIFGEQIDIWLNDISAVLMCLLAASGIYMWVWRRRKIKKQVKIFTFSIRWHRILVGPLAIFGILYLSVSGILLDHSDDLRSSFRNIQFERNQLGPVYQLHDWQNQITSLAALPGQILLGSRHGLFAWRDDNPHQLQRIYAGYAWSTTRIGEQIYIGGMGAPNGIYDGMKITPAPAAGHMPSDVSELNADVIWKNPHGLHRTDGTELSAAMPPTDTVPLFYALDNLHSGLIFHAQWKWFNDLIAIAALLAMGTGLYRLFKWLKVRMRVAHKRRRESAHVQNR